MKHQLGDWLIVLNKDVILEAIRRTHLNGKSFIYLNAILTDFNQKGVRTYGDISAYDKSFKHRQHSFTKQVHKKESLPKWAEQDYADIDERVDDDTTQQFKETLERIRRKRE